VFVKVVTDSISVPGNASRSFATEQASQGQPRGRIQFGWDPVDPYLQNVQFNSKIINYDSSYCTSVFNLSGGGIPTLSYFPLVKQLLGVSVRVTDVGCGQGEFVNAIRDQGVDAIGFDPVLHHENEYLFARYWDAKDSPQTDLIVMRCVLPHIPQPWKFLDQIATYQKSAMILIEFQKLEWILRNKCWYQFCHDHVNQFAMFDFQSRYEVLLQGSFANNEWGWVLFSPNSRRRVTPNVCAQELEIQELFDARTQFLLDLKRSNRRRFIWGAAAKGAVLSDACHQVGGRPTKAIDANPHKWSRFLEGSGIQVIAPAQCGEILTADAEVWVANPNHLTDVAKFLEDFSVEVTTPIMAAL
jgi:hypothetical protein